MNGSILLISLTSSADNYGADLHAGGYTYIYAEDIERAYSLLRGGLLPDTVIFDTDLTPDAVGLIQDIRRAYRRMPILVIGSSGAEKALAHSVGVDAFLFHPLKPGRLVEVASELIS